MKRLLIILILPAFFVQCKSKKIKLADDDTVDVVDFVEFFPDLKLPYFAADSSFSGKETDSSSIGNKIFSQFVPDSVLKNEFGSVKPKIYPIGKVQLKNAETYIFIKAYAASKSEALLLAFDKDNNFITYLPLVIKEKNKSLIKSGGMDAKYVVTKTQQNKKAEGEQYNEQKTVYILNSEAKEFSIIMSDMGVAESEQDIINPIDTLGRKNKLSGDYTKDKRNIVSFRDGKDAGKLAFFVHFEKDNGECSGELKGEADLRSPKIAVFRAQGNPCELEFIFEGNKVSMKEVAACGSYRDIRCFFEGAYSRKKEIKKNEPAGIQQAPVSNRKNKKT